MKHLNLPEDDVVRVLNMLAPVPKGIQVGKNGLNTDGTLFLLFVLALPLRMDIVGQPELETSGSEDLTHH